jgi:hypothetical protein
MTLPDLAVLALRQAIGATPNLDRLEKVADAVKAMQAEEQERIAGLRDERADLKSDVRKALERCQYAEIDKDRRLWSDDERDELSAAEAEYEAATEALMYFDQAHPEAKE